ncbi:MAG: hypothetical protein HC792_02750 [Acaryochloridaceae cyanobacterium CSU_5_19]|nr:hypothetical protein [Acaryochloridaceae cyanobacterium CSU_5_19]
MLIDYGITTRLLSKLGQRYPHYQKLLESQGDALAPELISGNFRSDTDLYAVGKTLLQALEHQIPATEQDFADLFGETTQIFAKMCQTDPEARYPSIYDACRAVRNHWHKLWKAELSLKNSQNRDLAEPALASSGGMEL